MDTYRVRLESTVDSQARIITCTAGSDEEAKAIAEARELELVAYDATRIAAPQRDGKNTIIDLHRTVDIERVGRSLARRGDGKILRLGDVPLRGTDVAAWHTHHQQEPYRFASIEKLDPIWSLVEDAKALQQNPKEWKRVLAALKEAGIPLAAVSGTLYGLTAQKQLDGGSHTSFPIDWAATDVIKVALTTSSYTPDQDTDDFFNDVTNEITGSGYSAGGATLGSPTSTYDTGTDTIRLDAGDTAWTSSTLTARLAVIYKSTGTSSTSPVIGWVDFGTDEVTSSGTLTITWDATGIVVYDVS